MTKEINFDNLTVKYNNNKINSEIINKSHKSSMLYAILITLLLIVIPIILLDVVGLDDNIFSILLVVLIDIAVFLICLGILFKIYEKSSQKQIEYIDWLLKLNHDDIEIGWFNDRYIVIIYTDHIGYTKKELKSFIDCDFTLVDDNVDKSKPIHATIDMSSANVEVTVTNKE